MIVDSMRPKFRSWRAVAAYLGIALARLLRTRDRGGIDKRVGKAAEAAMVQPCGPDEITLGLGI